MQVQPPVWPLEEISITLAKSASILIMLGLFTGLYISMAMTGAVEANPSMVVSSHLNALLGGFWLLGVGWSLRWCSLDPKKANWMMWLLIVSNYANWLVTAIKALFNVHAVEFNGQSANDVLHLMLVLTVVIPSIVGCALWVWGLMKERS
jgi:(hydroxyamino)benzene mutase